MESVDQRNERLARIPGWRQCAECGRWWSPTQTRAGQFCQHDDLKRVAGVEPLSPSLEDCAPPAHDTPTEAFGRHFLRCFFCRIGDRYTEDHFCEDGRDLIVGVLDEYADRVFA